MCGGLLAKRAYEDRFVCTHVGCLCMHWHMGLFVRSCVIFGCVYMKESAVCAVCGEFTMTHDTT